VSEIARITPADNNTSFPSGHVTLAFSVVTSSAEIANLRGYRHAPWIWRIGMPVAAFTAYLRVAADRHYLTDVLMGAGVGSGIGFAVPYFGHRRHDARVPSVGVTPAPRGGKMLVAQWVW
jgi:membrane-associated phospholipid phosphatase